MSTMESKYVCIHYGFGDYVACFGLIKELSKQHDIILFAIPHRSNLHIENIKRLYNSIKNVQISTDDPKSYSDVLYVGWDKFFDAAWLDPSINCIEYFYNQVEVPLNLMWDNFYFERDMKKEKEIFDSLGLNEEYIFLHDDPVRGFVIDRKYIKPDTRIVHLIELGDISILDILYVVEKAKEVHVYNTGLIPFIELMNINHPNLNYHKYIRPLPYEQPILKLNWNIIN